MTKSKISLYIWYTDFTMKDTEQQIILSRRISDLPLKIEGTHFEELIDQLYLELEKAGISLKPGTYLSDGWGCPNLIPVIGIPFYLADQNLSNLRESLTGIEAEDDTEIMMILRHEAGHAFNYAYRIYQEPECQEVFGNFFLPYNEEYKVCPFSNRFVRHVAGWYVQKHPDDDFAETFAVWLTPGSNWKKVYAGSPAMAKLIYIEKIVGKFGNLPPMVTDGRLDIPLNEMTMTLESWFKEHKEGKGKSIILHDIINEDLKRLFPVAEGRPAIDILRNNRRQLIRDVHYWTGIDRDVLVALVDNILAHIQILELKIAPDTESAIVGSVSVFITTLVMNYVYQGRFIND